MLRLQGAGHSGRAGGHISAPAALSSMRTCPARVRQDRGLTKTGQALRKASTVSHLSAAKSSNIETQPETEAPNASFLVANSAGKAGAPIAQRPETFKLQLPINSYTKSAQPAKSREGLLHDASLWLCLFLFRPCPSDAPGALWDFRPERTRGHLPQQDYGSMYNQKRVNNILKLRRAACMRLVFL